jgi:hydrogenase maturation factor HypF (carbamoyltransferase family)
MSIYRFISLNLIDMVEATIKGTFIADMKLENETRLLYHVDDFFVEVIYDHERLVIRRIRAFNSMDQLDPYLDSIDLTQML